jgi:hypothetical protein
MATAPITVYARRNIKGARRRVLAVQHVNAGGTTRAPGLAWLPPGGVDVYFTTADGMAHVFLPPEVVARIKAGPPQNREPPAQVAPPLLP